jgi:hypothetical protein
LLAAVLTPLNSSNFVLREETLLSGQIFTFSVEIYDAQTDIMLGANTIFLLTNEAPATGSIQPPGASNQLETVEFFAPAWSDKDLPLRYIFSLIQGTREIFLTELLESPVARALVPFSGASELRVRVFDRQGAMATRKINHIIGKLSSNDIATRLSELTSSFRQRAGWGDLRGASQIAIALLIAKSQQNDPATPQFREEIISFLSLSLSTRKLAWVDSPSVVNLLSLITNGSNGLSQATIENCTRIIEESVAAASTQVPTKLSITSSQLARFTTVGFLETAIQVAKSVISQAAQSNAAISARIRAAIESLVVLQSRFIVADELAAQIISESIRATSVVVSDRTITESGGAITVANVTIQLVGSGGGDVIVGIITWSNGTFSSEAGGGKVVQLLLSGGTATTVSAEFEGAGKCAVFIDSSQTWDGSLCRSKPQPNGNVVCECANPTASNRVTLSLLFGGTTDATPTLVPQLTNDAIGAPVGAIVGAVVGVLVALIIVAVLVVLLVPSIRAKVLPYSMARLNDGGNNGEQMQTIEDAQPERTSRWEPASKPVERE